MYNLYVYTQQDYTELSRKNENYRKMDGKHYIKRAKHTSKDKQLTFSLVSGP